MPFTHTPRSPYKHTPWTYLALPKVHPVLLLLRAPALLLHHHLPAQVHFTTYLALPSLPRGPSCHIRWSLPSSAPRTFTPHTPSPRPVSAGQPSFAAGRLLFVDTPTPVHQMVGRWICVCVSVCARALLINVLHHSSGLEGRLNPR